MKSNSCLLPIKLINKSINRDCTTKTMMVGVYNENHIESASNIPMLGLVVESGLVNFNPNEIFGK